MLRLPVSDDEISVPEAAKLLCLEPRTVCDMIERGELPLPGDIRDEWAKGRRAPHLTRQERRHASASEALRQKQVCGTVA